jgi:hypothetical protein
MQNWQIAIFRVDIEAISGPQAPALARSWNQFLSPQITYSIFTILLRYYFHIYIELLYKTRRT